MKQASVSEMLFFGHVMVPLSEKSKTRLTDAPDFATTDRASRRPRTVSVRVHCVVSKRSPAVPAILTPIPSSSSATNASARRRRARTSVMWSLRMAVLICCAIHITNPHARHLSTQAALVHRRCARERYFPLLLVARVLKALVAICTRCHRPRRSHLLATP